MVRAMGATATEERKGTTLNAKVSVKKKPTFSGIWPCKINGCNKQFAREADLKRHQRTTKLHSMPSYACPQCDATFTRTDAQRRHQKSRHNGVIIEAIETTTGGDENSNSRSRSGTPLSNNKENPSSVPVQAHQGIPTATGSSSYYRQHTALVNPYIPPRFQHNQLDHQTSSARTAPPWSSYSHWLNGVPLPPPSHMSPISYIHHPTCYPSPHYRPHTTAYPSPSPSDSSQHPSGAGTSTPLRTDSTDLSGNSPSHTAVSSNDSSSISCIDPDSHSELTAEDVVAAMRVVMSMQVESAEDAQDHETKHGYLSASHSLDGMADNNRDLEDKLNSLHDYSPSLERPEPMEHILTEDGEPMLNPAELLTQESLASPPPS